jgi:hypothetical protein
MARPSSDPISATPKLDPNRPEIRKLKRLFEHKPLTLRDYHAVGEQLRRLSEDPDIAYRGSGWRAKVAQILGQSEAALNKCLQFRNSYAEDELPEVKGLGVGWSSLTIALGIPKKRRRHQLLRQAQNEGWNERELQRAVQRLKGSHRGGGRRRRPPEAMGLLADVSELTRLTTVWTDYYDTVWTEGQEEYATELGAMTSETSENVRKHVGKAVKELKLLREKCGEALEGLKVLGRQLGRPEGPPDSKSVR